ncbi:spore germination protein [Thalassobacillus pellis]|uniref:spore germination protein n=1 Tax=Thalassobacillus pellis TaxID=748008 RepID=UPI001960410D|nr:spore germination protein [Thalassobacillus pellis]MBM7551214.1 spore germination protein KA [Thalassobacillus pellis]
MGFFRKIFQTGEGQQEKASGPSVKEPQQPSFLKLSANIDYLTKALKNSSDLKVRILNDGKAALLYYESLADQEKLQKKIFSQIESGRWEEVLDLPHGKHTENLEEALKTLLTGHAVYVQEGSTTLTQFEVTSQFNRSVEEPINERVVRGSHEGFVENVMININLIRKRLMHRDLTFQYFRVGKKTNTNIVLAFMDGIADPNIIEQVTNRIKSVTSDAIFSPGYMEEFIEDAPFSPFPQMMSTERPDRAVANLMDGRVLLMAEGSPTALVLPVTFFMFYQSPDDYNSRWISGTFIRLIRLMSFIIAIGLPAFYIAIIGFHYEVLPDDLILPVKGSINEIAYPPIVEALIMVIIVELIRESGIRLPQPIGQTIGIVGGLVIGDAVVQAGLISNLMVIVVALTAIASFVVPSYELSTTLRILTFPLIFFAGTLGFVGIVFGMLFILIHLCKLESFGTPYFAPVAPLRIKDLKDTFVRLPLFWLDKRPKDAKPVKSKAIGESREWTKIERQQKRK